MATYASTQRLTMAKERDFSADTAMLTSHGQQSDTDRGDHSQGEDDAMEDVVRPAQPSRPIQRLEEAVVNRIAAGEVIHRPANALKELIENSLDAGADLIKITLKEGGLKMLQIQDNGCGIRPSDLPLLCERFATSKLRDFSDLSSMTTFGFRGEALASISFVAASMSVVSKTKDEALAYKAFYTSGEMVPGKPGQSREPKACAGVEGTTISAQDLFYNVPQRRRALKSAAEEYNRALDVAAKYALHYGSRGVGFVCKKSGSNAADLSTPASATTKTIDTIRLLHGNAVARELIPVKIARDDQLGFSLNGWISGANWSTKRITFLCFINNRLVDCPTLKRSFESLYSALLPKGGHPWIYVSLDIDPGKLDVNVHPTKREVHFLDEEDIIELICSASQTVLAGANSSRTFQFTQAILPGASLPRAVGESSRNGSSKDPSNTQLAPSSQYPQHLVRVDNKTRTLDGIFAQLTQPASHAAQNEADGGMLDNGLVDEDSASSRLSTIRPRRNRMQVPLSECSLTSVSELRTALTQQRHGALSEILSGHTFVGVVDLTHGLSLIQHGTKLYLTDHDALIEECAYQLCIRQFGALGRRKVKTSNAKVRDLIRLGIEMEGADTADIEAEAGMSIEEIVERITAHLLDNSSMLSEYFSLDLDVESEELKSLPDLLPGQERFPIENLPSFLLRLGTQVDWTDEKGCFESFARELAYAHCLPYNAKTDSPDTSEDLERNSDVTVAKRAEDAAATAKWKIQHVWFPLMASRSSGFAPPRSLIKEDKVIQVASLNDLYRIFERC